MLIGLAIIEFNSRKLYIFIITVSIIAIRFNILIYKLVKNLNLSSEYSIIWWYYWQTDEIILKKYVLRWLIQQGWREHVNKIKTITGGSRSVKIKKIQYSNFRLNLIPSKITKWIKASELDS